jgi:hypothetical protein
MNENKKEKKSVSASFSGVVDFIFKRMSYLKSCKQATDRLPAVVALARVSPVSFFPLQARAVFVT